MSEGEETQKLRARIADFGLRASEGLELDELLGEAARQVARGLGVSHVKVLQLLPEERCLLVRAGVGWSAGVVGRAKVGADIASPAGYALRSGRPVISNSLETDERFRLPSLLRDHGVKSAVNVIVKNQDNVFGVLEADSRAPRDFGADDVVFLQTYANILSFAIEQHRLVRQNAELAARQETLLLELQHRIKNNNQKLLALIHLQLAGVTSIEARKALEQIASRIQALSSVNEHFADQAQPNIVDLGQYLMALISATFGFHGDQSTSVKVDARMAQVRLSTEAAQAVGLIVNEFLTNSFKYAFPQAGGRFSAALDQAGGAATLTLADDGPGVPQDVAQGLGMRLIDLLVAQLEGTHAWHHDGGTRLEVRFPVGNA